MYRIGIDLGGTFIKAGVVDENYRIVGTAACPTALPRPAEDILFIDAQVYAWRALDELAVSAFYTPLRDLGRAALQQLLAERRYPASEQTRIEANRPFYGL